MLKEIGISLVPSLFLPSFRSFHVPREKREEVSFSSPFLPPPFSPQVGACAADHISCSISILPQQECRRKSNGRRWPPPPPHFFINRGTFEKEGDPASPFLPHPLFHLFGRTARPAQIRIEQGKKEKEGGGEGTATASVFLAGEERSWEGGKKGEEKKDTTPIFPAGPNAPA